MMKGIRSILPLGTALAQAEPVPTALKVGDSIPDVTLCTVDNQEVKLRNLVAGKTNRADIFSRRLVPLL
jgi:hypothetical protein